MKTVPLVTQAILVGLVFIAGCEGAHAPGTTAVATRYPTPAATDSLTATLAPPTPIAPGQTIVDDGLELTMDRYEFSKDYTTEYDTVRQPPEGKEFLWVHVVLTNMAGAVRDAPRPEHFSLLAYHAELKPSYGHRRGFSDYPAFDAVIYPDQTLAAWLRFEVPAAAELPELQFAFLPKSTRVSFDYSPSSHAWADHPVYIWTLAP